MNTLPDNFPYAPDPQGAKQGQGQMCSHNTVGFCPSCAEWMKPIPPMPANVKLTFHGPQFSPPAQKGWLCPKCETVNAPWMPTCFSCTTAAAAKLGDVKEATSAADDVA